MEVIILIGGVVCLCACQYAFRYTRVHRDNVADDSSLLHADALVIPAESTPLVEATMIDSDVSTNGNQIDYV